MKRQEYLAQRNQLLCEDLKSGMSVDEVLGVLHQAGDFTIRRSEWLGGDVELGINFTDPKGYGAFELRFENNQYIQAYISGFYHFEVICDFYQPS